MRDEDVEVIVNDLTDNGGANGNPSENDESDGSYSGNGGSSSVDDGANGDASGDGDITIIDALDRVLDSARCSGLSDEFWDANRKDVDYLCRRMELNPRQVVVVALMCEEGEPVSWRQIGSCFGMSRLRAMGLTPDIEELQKKRWIIACEARERGGSFQGYKLKYGVVTACRLNRKYEPENIEGLDEQQFVDHLIKDLGEIGRDNRVPQEELARCVVQLAEANPEIPLAEKLLRLDDDLSRLLLVHLIADYSRFGGTEREGLTVDNLQRCFDNDMDFDFMIDELLCEQHNLFVDGLIEHKCNDGIADTGCICLTSKCRETLLGEFRPRVRVVRKRGRRFLNSMISPDSISAKTLYYNPEERLQIDRLRSLLDIGRLRGVQNRLAETGMRQGIACLFYGAPGTGKTETALQIARLTGRQIMQVDIAGMRDKFVGETEKNIKDLFNRYREACKNCEETPILLFNEADALINSRFSKTSNSVEKMDNAMQNIILQEMENLDGILIATTNLTGNLDRAFDRRFLFKI